MSLARIDLFNKILLDTVNFLMNKFPEDKDISYSQYHIEFGSINAPKYVFNEFMTYVPQYIDKINSKDETFFLELSSSDEDLKGFKLHDKWVYFSDTEKDYLFVQFQKLVKLGSIIQNQ
jgi:hypothetical protein